MLRDIGWYVLLLAALTGVAVAAFQFAWLVYGVLDMVPTDTLVNMLTLLWFTAAVAYARWLWGYWHKPRRKMRVVRGGTEPVLYKDHEFMQGLTLAGPLSESDDPIAWLAAAHRAEQHSGHVTGYHARAAQQQYATMHELEQALQEHDGSELKDSTPGALAARAIGLELMDTYL